MAHTLTTGDVHVEDVKPITAEGVITGLNVTVNYATINGTTTDSEGNVVPNQVTRIRETKDMYSSLSSSQKSSLQDIYVTLATAVKAEFE